MQKAGGAISSQRQERQSGGTFQVDTDQHRDATSNCLGASRLQCKHQQCHFQQRWHHSSFTPGEKIHPIFSPLAHFNYLGYALQLTDYQQLHPVTLPCC